MINRRLLIYGAPKAATGGTLTVGNVGNTVPCEISDAMPQP